MAATLFLAWACSGDDGAPDPAASGAPDGAADVTAAVDASADAPAPGADAAPDAPALAPLYAFIGSADGKIRVYDVDAANGKLTFKKENAAGTHPSFLAVDGAHRRVFAVDEVTTGRLRSFAFEPSTGALTQVDEKSTGGADPTHVSLRPQNDWVFVANYTGNNAAWFTIDGNGKLGDPITRIGGELEHWIGTDPAGKNLFVVAKGDNYIQQLGFDPANGEVVNNLLVFPPDKAGARHLAFHPTQPRGFLVNETAVSVTTLDYDATAGTFTTKGTVSAVPSGMSLKDVTGAEIVVHPSGHQLYASTRGGYNSIAVFDVAVDGALSLVQSAPTGGPRPRSFAIDPEGSVLFAANQDAAEVVSFRIGVDGRLTSIGKTIDVPTPSFIGLARVP